MTVTKKWPSDYILCVIYNNYINIPKNHNNFNINNS